MGVSNIHIFTAKNKSDFERIHQLNHSIFSIEIGQHPLQSSGYLVDKFHAKNHYVIAEKDNEIVGMICAHWVPPYSVEEKCSDFFRRFSNSGSVAEIRLLAVFPSLRGTSVAWKLMHKLASDLVERGINSVVISGIADRRKTYEKIGFKVICPPVKSGNAFYYPMGMTKDEFITANSKLAEQTISPKALLIS